MSDDNEASHSDSSAATSSVSSIDNQQKTSERLDVDHMYSDQSQDGQTRSRTTVIRDIVKVIISQTKCYSHEQDNVRTNTESVQCLSIKYYNKIHITQISELACLLA